MSIPIPLITPGAANDYLVRRYVEMETSCPSPEGTPPTLVVVMPTAWENKYQLMLYAQAAQHRVAVCGLRQPDALAEISWPGPVVLHCHWFAHVFEDVQSAAQAGRRLKLLQDHLSRFRDRTGAKLLWTAHNIVPHGNRFPEVFLELRRWLFETFDAIHVMEQEHVPLLEAAFGRRAPAHFVAPHMTYSGMVPDFVTRTEARAHFGLPPEAFVFGYFGSLQPYKDPMALVDAFTALKSRTDQPLAAIIGGMPSDLALVQQLQDRVQGMAELRFEPRKVAEYEIQYFHRAADAMVLPYKDTLNSGAALMASSFRTPFLMPETPVSRALKGLGVISYDAEHPDALTQIMAATLDGLPEDVFSSEKLAARAPHRVSDQFFEGLEAVLRRPTNIASGS